jgi:putative transposase
MTISSPERLWRSVKYEEVYLKEYATLKEAEAGIATYFAFYNATRPHQALAYQMPQQVHFALARKLPPLY